MPTALKLKVLRGNLHFIKASLFYVQTQSLSAEVLFTQDYLEASKLSA